MDCKFDINLLQAYIEESIEPLEKIFVEEHLKVCRKCRKEFTELKLLFWELKELDHIKVEVPEEVDTIAQSLIDDIFAEKTDKFGIKDFIKIQRKVLEQSGKFIEYLPGSALVESRVKRVPEAISNTTNSLLKGSLKLLLEKG